VRSSSRRAAPRRSLQPAFNTRLRALGPRIAQAIGHLAAGSLMLPRAGVGAGVTIVHEVSAH
jgi:hypothetical protein